MPTDFSIQRWLEELPDEEIEREMEELNAQIQALANRHNALREARDLKQRFRDFYGGGETPASHAEVKIADRGVAVEGDTITSVTKVYGQEPRPPSISKSVVLLMESVSRKREWSVADLYDGLVSRGWLTDSAQSSRSLGAALSRMASDGEIRRVARGLYAPSSLDAASSSPSSTTVDDATPVASQGDLLAEEGGEG